MRVPAFGAACAATIIISVLLRVPQTSAVHLVSNQQSTADNQNNPPVQFVPNMARKLGLPVPQSQNHNAPEVSYNDEALTSAIRQLMESHKRQTAFLERLAALAPKSRTEDPYSTTRVKSTQNKMSKASQPSIMPAPESSVVMRPSNQRQTNQRLINQRPQQILKTENTVRTDSSDNQDDNHVKNSETETVQTTENVDRTVEKILPMSTSTPARVPVLYPTHPSIYGSQMYPQPHPVRPFMPYIPYNYPSSDHPALLSQYPHILSDTQRVYHRYPVEKPHPLPVQPVSATQHSRTPDFIQPRPQSYVGKYDLPAHPKQYPHIPNDAERPPHQSAVEKSHPLTVQPVSSGQYPHFPENFQQTLLHPVENPHPVTHIYPVHTPFNGGYPPRPYPVENVPGNISPSVYPDFRGPYLAVPQHSSISNVPSPNHPYVYRG